LARNLFHRQPRQIALDHDAVLAVTNTISFDARRSPARADRCYPADKPRRNPQRARGASPVPALRAAHCASQNWSLPPFPSANCWVLGRYGRGFNYEAHPCTISDYDEPEGLDFLNMWGRGGAFNGFLHAVMISNDTTDTGSSVYLKHFNQ
jgi:hypothetical protein